MTWPNYEAAKDALHVIVAKAINETDAFHNIEIIDVTDSDVEAIVDAALDGKVLREKQECKHGHYSRHQGIPKPDCVECDGKGRYHGVSGSDAYTYDCRCVEKCRGGKLVRVWPTNSDSTSSRLVEGEES